MRKILLLLCILTASVSSSAFFDQLFNFGDSSPVVTDQQKLVKFRNNYKLLFVYTSRCGYCHRFAPVLRSFVNEKKLKIESISGDGKPIEGFSNFKYSPKTLDELGVQSYPIVFVLDNNNKLIDTLSSGNVSKNKLSNNFNDILNHLY